MTVCTVFAVVAIGETYLHRSDIRNLRVDAKVRAVKDNAAKELLPDKSETVSDEHTASPPEDRHTSARAEPADDDAAPNDPATARREATLGKLYRGIDFPIEFLDDQARSRFKSFYFNCSSFGYDDRFVRLETLIRSSFFQLAGAKTRARLTVHSSMDELVVDVTIGKAAPIRFLVVDENGAILMSHLSDNALPEGCSDGVPYVGPIYETSEELNIER